VYPARGGFRDAVDCVGLFPSPGAILAGRDCGEGRTGSGVASQHRKYVPNLPIDIRYRSRRRSHEIVKVIFGKNRPEASNLAFWMPTPGDDPMYRWGQSHIQYELTRSYSTHYIGPVRNHCGLKDVLNTFISLVQQSHCVRRCSFGCRFRHDLPRLSIVTV
jgi:hypothetical protein